VLFWVMPAPTFIALTAIGRREPAHNRIFAASVTKPVKRRGSSTRCRKRWFQSGPAVHVVPSAASGPQLGDRHPLRILVAEDNLVNQKVVLSMLAAPRIPRRSRRHGLEAVDAIQRLPYDVVFMDLQMPELDGFGAVRRIRSEHAEGRRPRVIALTANALEEDREECLAAGMDDYLSKPLQRDKLEAALMRAHRIDALAAAPGQDSPNT